MDWTGVQHAGSEDRRQHSMQEWVDRFAGELGTEGLTAEQVDELLEIAREVAHRTGERRLAPIATFIAGLMAARGGEPIDQAIRRARESLGRILPAPTA
jgi:hypothetical protein